jgi:drug/metabolite transporter (DMT)-like permease
VLVSIFWGANPVAIKLALVDVPPLRLGVLRFVVGGLVIILWAGLTGRLAGFHIASHEWRPLVGLGVLLGVQNGSMNIGTSLTSAAHSALLLNLYAVHTVALAHVLIPGDRLTARRLGGVLVAYAGIVVLFGRQLTGGSSTVLGDVIVFASGFLLAERTVFMARMVQRLDQVKMLLAQAVVSILIFLVGSLAFEDAPTRWTAQLAGSLAYQGVLISGFNFIVNLWLLKRYRPSALAVFFLTQPIFGVVAAAVVAGDRLTIDLILASVAVAMGIGLGSL